MLQCQWGRPLSARPAEEQPAQAPRAEEAQAQAQAAARRNHAGGTGGDTQGCTAAAAAGEQAALSWGACAFGVTANAADGWPVAADTLL